MRGHNAPPVEKRLENRDGKRSGMENRAGKAGFIRGAAELGENGVGEMGGGPKTSSHPPPKGFVIYRNTPVPPNLQRSDFAASHRIKK